MLNPGRSAQVLNTVAVEFPETHMDIGVLRLCPPVVEHMPRGHHVAVDHHLFHECDQEACAYGDAVGGYKADATNVVRMERHGRFPDVVESSPHGRESRSYLPSRDSSRFSFRMVPPAFAR